MTISLVGGHRYGCPCQQAGFIVDRLFHQFFLTESPVGQLLTLPLPTLPSPPPPPPHHPTVTPSRRAPSTATANVRVTITMEREQSSPALWLVAVRAMVVGVLVVGRDTVVFSKTHNMTGQPKP